MTSERRNSRSYKLVGNLPYWRRRPCPVLCRSRRKSIHLALSVNLVNKCTLEIELAVQLFPRIIKNETKWVALYSVHQSSVWNSACSLRYKSKKKNKKMDISSGRFDIWGRFVSIWARMLHQQLRKVEPENKLEEGSGKKLWTLLLALIRTHGNLPKSFICTNLLKQLCIGFCRLKLTEAQWTCLKYFTWLYYTHTPFPEFTCNL